jgi:hypothetical protein
MDIFEVYVVETPSKLQAMPLYRGRRTPALFRGTIESGGFLRLMLPILVSSSWCHAITSDTAMVVQNGAFFVRTTVRNIQLKILLDS